MWNIPLHFNLYTCTKLQNSIVSVLPVQLRHSPRNTSYGSSSFRSVRRQSARMEAITCFSSVWSHTTLKCFKNVCNNWKMHEYRSGSCCCMELCLTNVWSQPFYLFLSNGLRYSPELVGLEKMTMSQCDLFSRWTCPIKRWNIPSDMSLTICFHLYWTFILLQNTLLVYQQETNGLDGAVILFSSVWNQGPLKCFKNALKKSSKWKM